MQKRSGSPTACRLAHCLSAAVVGLLLLAAQAGAQAAPPMPGGGGSGTSRSKAADLPAITSASPAVVKLEAGGDAVLATLKGSRMELITGAYAYLGGQPRPEVSVGLKYVPGAALPRRGLTLVARQGAPAGEYELRLDVDGYVMAVPATLFKIVVGDVAPAPAPAPDTKKPDEPPAATPEPAKPEE